MLLALTLSTVLAEPIDYDAMSAQYQDVTFVIAASEKSYSQKPYSKRLRWQKSLESCTIPTASTLTHNTKMTMVG